MLNKAAKSRVLDISLWQCSYQFLSFFKHTWWVTRSWRDGHTGTTLLPITRWWILVRRTLVSHLGSEQKCQQFRRRVLLRCCASVTKVRVWQLWVFERFRGVSERSLRHPDSHTPPHQYRRAQGYQLCSGSQVLFYKLFKNSTIFSFSLYHARFFFSGIRIKRWQKICNWYHKGMSSSFFPFKNALCHCIYQKNSLVVGEISQTSQKLAGPNGR